MYSNTSFTLFANYDVLFITLITIIYLIYSYSKRIKEDIYIRFILIFFTSYLLLFYWLSFKLSINDAKELFLYCILPVFTFFHWVIHFRKNKKVNQFLLIVTAIYVAFFLLMIIVHYFSNM